MQTTRIPWARKRKAIDSRYETLEAAALALYLSVLISEPQWQAINTELEKRRASAISALSR